MTNQNRSESRARTGSGRPSGPSREARGNLGKDETVRGAGGHLGHRTVTVNWFGSISISCQLP